MSSALMTKRGRLRAAYPIVSDTDQSQTPGRDALNLGLEVCKSKLSHLSSQPSDLTDTNEIYKVSNALSGLFRASIEAERWACERGGAVREAGELLKAGLRDELAQNPELLKVVLDLVDAGTVKLLQGGQS